MAYEALFGYLLGLALLCVVVGMLLRSGRPDEQSQFLADLEFLREGEGSQVVLYSDNPEFFGPNNALLVNGEWTNWTDRRFTGPNLYSATRGAALAKFEHSQKNASNEEGELQHERHF